MKLGIVSDTHKNIKNLDKAVDFLKSLGVESIIHLGDDYADMDEIGEEKVIRVPGVFSQFYQQKDVANRRVERFSGWRILLTHTPEAHENDLDDDIKPEEEIEQHRVDIVLHGHTHIPGVREDNGILFVNPGHLRDADKKGYPPTCGYMEITDDYVIIRIYRLQDESIYKEIKFRRP